MTLAHNVDEHLLCDALKAASDTRWLLVEPGARRAAAKVFETAFGAVPAIIVADENTFAAAGRDIEDSFRNSSHSHAAAFIFGCHVYANYDCILELEAALKQTDAVPVAVGSGTINDLTKLAAHRIGRPYMVAGTAASMDGYTAYGASITYKGSKQTFECPAPLAVVADLDVMAAAPPGMNASGYADLLAKVPAGGDWILAEAAGEEPIDGKAWEAVQSRLRAWLGDPEGIASGDPAAVRHLVYGLMMTGFAMQALRSSRPASGADHQFSHLWDMQHHTHNGVPPSHGSKVGIGSLASIAAYDEILRRDLLNIDIDAAVERWPSLAQMELRIAAVLGAGELGAKAVEETRAKYVSRDRLHSQLTTLRTAWLSLSASLGKHLLHFSEARDMLRAAGCPCEPEQIGISRSRLYESYEQAWYIRRRYTILDFVQRAGIADSVLETSFSPSGPWGEPHR
ncbi:MAG TPA: sn-glycerol-1-phosphate dehydrogenase [Bryobacteraceae bacterium]